MRQAPLSHNKSKQTHTRLTIKLHENYIQTP